ncbi:PEP-CTERM sorting domain-containing protein [Luteolibacter sp. GHJ8]|uniref:PEP-CTERM sorting domain-containing protein n=1 Tax=Luteolibacter rhizosphaerae TaxID=2989719 RepID=A0ABT3G9X6_9BACT|nr:PEP-CTERM sorting domain-containing protein [Luteolibacter rhizosphaerae]MCW1916274.1 PEP-CTERM sorting domain-containing protein [Luteolibacter rhizosphaerae]
MNQTALSRALLIAAAALGLQSAGAATVLDLTPTGYTWNTADSESSVLGGRSIYIRANETFSIDQITWHGGVTAGNYEFVIYQGQGEQAVLGAILGSGSSALPEGAGPQTIGLNFTFEENTEYVISFRATPDTYEFDGPYAWDYLSWGEEEESDLGLITLLDGRHGFTPDENNNSWTTHFSMNVVPEPSSSLLGLVGLCGIVLRRRRA